MEKELLCSNDSMSFRLYQIKEPLSERAPSPPELINMIFAVTKQHMESVVAPDGKGRVENAKPVMVELVFREDGNRPSQGVDGLTAGALYECTGPLIDISPVGGYLTVGPLRLQFVLLQNIVIDEVQAMAKTKNEK